MEKRQTPVGKMNKIIVIGGDHHNTLGVIRSLGEKRLRPDALIVSPDGETFVGRSKYISKLHIVRRNEDIVPYLINNVKSDSEKTVVICCHDTSSSEIDLHADELRPWFILPGAEKQGHITYLMNKKVMSELAVECGLKIPFALYPEHIPLHVDENEFPYIAKPLISKNGRKNDIRVCTDLSELNDAVKNIGIGNVQLQQFVDKDFEYQLIGCSTDKEVFIPGVSHILRPCKGSNTSFLRYEPLAPDFCDVERCKEFVRRTGYKGLFSLEFLRDKNGYDYFMEINFRNDGNAICVTAAGINLPYIWYLFCIGKDYSKEMNQKVSSVYVMPDSAELKLLLTGKINFFEYVGDLIKTNRFMEFDRKDLRPFWRMIIQKKKYI